MDSSDVVLWAFWLLGVALIGIGTLLVRRYGPLVRATREYVILQELAWMACRAAEQLGRTHFWTGELKRAFAREVIGTAAHRLGLEFSDAEIDAAIEATVRELSGREHGGAIG